MKITHNKVGQNLSLRDSNVAGSGKTDAAAAAAKAGGATAANALGDLAGLDASKVDVSKRAQDMRRAKELAMKTPDVDEAKVARLQKLIDEGNYKIDASAIADKMIAEQGSWE